METPSTTKPKSIGTSGSTAVDSRSDATSPSTRDRIHHSGNPSSGACSSAADACHRPRLDAYLWKAAAFGNSGVRDVCSAHAVNGISLFSKNEPLAGTYAVDPALPGRLYMSEDLDGVVSGHEHRVHGSLRAEAGGTRGSRMKKAGHGDYDASFRTRRGRIDLNIAIVTTVNTNERTQRTKIPASVSVSSRHGDVVLNVTEIQPGRILQLDVSTCTGNILVLLPESFAGHIEVPTRDLDSYADDALLPNLAPRCSIVRKDGHVTTLRVNGLPPASEDSGEATEGSCCVANARTGRIIFGLSGVDEADLDSLWQKSTLHRIGKAIQAGLRGGVYPSS
ncbi:hypothetical protein BC628DRAFT_1351490 [Trametes gibbosa]|nr:hypothetical protein BC628DRAFT_1351490 [Trametes gibbosa]